MEKRLPKDRTIIAEWLGGILDVGDDPLTAEVESLKCERTGEGKPRRESEEKKDLFSRSPR